ncbi:MAG TPA: long-chain fatty acid--CoA ligase [Actinospica sp.]|nr:long-chain fatty acid--CoA ligase [Actinospica sp.]
MREYSVPSLYDVPGEANLTDIVHRNAERTPQRTVVVRKLDGVWHDVTAAEFLAEIESVADGLIALGVQPGDRVAIMSRTRYEWSVLDFAIWEAGAVGVPVYETSSAEQVAWILADSDVTAVFTETSAHTAVVASVRDRIPGLRYIWQIERDDGGSGALAVLAETGTGTDPRIRSQRRAALTAGTIATVIYTSGTTGRPKGCLLTHGNLLFEIGNAVELLPALFRSDEGRARTLLFLPLAHIFARIVHLGVLHGGAVLGHLPDPSHVAEELGAFRPTLVLAVPRVFEKIYNAAALEARSRGRVAAHVFGRAADTAVEWSRAAEQGRIGVRLRLRHAFFDRLVYAGIRARLGGRLRYAISGGAPLGEHLTRFFHGVGLSVCEGYGLTESGPAIAISPYQRPKAGTVGPPLPGTAVRIADDGEIQVKGPQVFAGYLHDEAATRAAFTADGYLRTGDLGSLDDDGYLSIRGRVKEILVTAAGKNVAPLPLEERLNAHPLIDQSLVVGDRRPYVAALITLDAEAVSSWLVRRGRDRDRPLPELCRDVELTGELQQAVDDANRSVSRAESIRRFAVLPTIWTVEGGHLSAKLSLKRYVISAEHAADIEDLYRES